MSREKFAALIGKSTKTIQRWEKGLSEPSEGDVLLIAHKTGVRAEWLWTGAGPIWAKGEERWNRIDLSSMGARIKSARGALTQQELAQHVGKGTSTLRNWEADRNKPSGGDLLLIAQATGVRVEWLLTGEGPMHVKGQEGAGRIDYSTVGARLAFMMESERLDVKAVAKICEVSNKTVYRWLSGESTPYDKFLRRLSRKTGFRFEWLKTGEGPMREEGAGEVAYPPAEERMLSTDAGEIIRVPVAPHGHGAGRGVVNEGAGSYVALSPSFLRRLTGGRLPERVVFSFVRGDSMMPYLADGAPILIEEVNEFSDGGRYAIYFDDSLEDEVKRVERLGGGRLRVSSDNRAFPPRIYEHLEDDLYRDVTNGHKLRMRIRGRVIYPPDTAPAVIGELRDFATALIREAATK